MTEYEELLRFIRQRRSVRRFQGRAVPREDILRLLEAARWAPSNHNRQPWRFLVLQDQKRIHALAEAVRANLAARLGALPAVASAYAGDLLDHASVFATAPALLVVLHQQPARFAAPLLEGLSHPTLVSGEPLSTAMAVQNLLLAAPTLGLGACVLTAPLLAPEAVARLVCPPPGLETTCFIALGYPDEAPEAPRRKNLAQIAEFKQDD
jgi:coenzyme F420-0:L-glutamate ligase / coenzyme F420-1:gamma-L-glutamate ligase